MKKILKPSVVQFLKVQGQGLLKSYAQVFFSDNNVLAAIIAAVSFFNPMAGLSGLWAALLTHLIAWMSGFNRPKIASGLYGFNSLLTGMALGSMFEPSTGLFIIVSFAALLNLMITLTLEGVFYKYGLSFLSLPFLFSTWTLLLATRYLSGLDLTPGSTFMLNKLYALGGKPLVNSYNWFFNLELPTPIVLYFRSVGAIFFQNYLFAGLLIVLGLLYYSRIAFTLSLLGFGTAWLYYELLGGNMADLSLGYIGFNFILTAIAAGGFFTVASPWSYIWVVFLSTLTSIFTTAATGLLSQWQLPVYSLPFNMAVLLFVYILKLRERNHYKPALVGVQLFSPEKNLYSQLNYSIRFGHPTGIYIGLPFRGKWTVTQGHDGPITHKEAWRHAWDFEITDEEGKTYAGKGLACDDYYCYGKPVLAPADGYVIEITDGIDDNPIGSINQQNNWGNTVILKHAEGIYSKMSHLRKGSIKVGKGSWIKQGEPIGQVGNSGRSPYPHLHFQIQSHPYIGSTTLLHPLSGYLKWKENEPEYISHGIPQQGDIVESIHNLSFIINAFNFTSGQEIKFRVSTSQLKESQGYWLVENDMFNQTWIFEPATGSRAGFSRIGNVFYILWYQGKTDSPLYYFALAHFRIIPGIIPGLVIHDRYPLHMLKRKLLFSLNDFIAPFYSLIQAHYRQYHRDLSSHFTRPEAFIESEAIVTAGKKTLYRYKFSTRIKNEGIEELRVESRNGVMIINFSSSEA
ncbi:MAG: urea transporter [Bacteroidales bacterium]